MQRQASVQDISWFIDLHTLGRLELNPPYQRRSVWTPNDRRFFLDTIFRNYPCPPVFIHKTIDDRGIATYNVVDGKQRLETIIKFATNKIAIAKDFGNVRLNGKKFKEIDPELKKAFWNYNVPVDFIDIPAGLDINEIFDRVNRNSRNLERQELRHARYNGWFITESETEADDDIFWQTIKVSSTSKAKRMRNVQLVSELLLIIIDNKIVGFDQDYLDEKYADYDSLEENENFDVDIYKQRKESIKLYLLEMENHNQCITNYAKTAYNLYTLFAFVALDKPAIPAAELSVRYDQFMTIVAGIKDDDLDVELENETEVRNLARKYFRNTRGANTDLFQRNERYTVLKDIFSNENS